MPKRLPEIKARFIDAARKRLTDNHDITIRQIALDCNTAVGTVYNYFPSKEHLLAAVMMEDWQVCCRRMREDADQACGPLAAIEATTKALRRFAVQYAPIWRVYAAARGSMAELNNRHRMIIEEISATVEGTLVRFNIREDPCLPEILAELILLASRTDDGFDRISSTLKKILA